MRTGNIIEYDGLSLSSIEWSAVFAGAFFAMCIGLIVGLIGFAIGFGFSAQSTLGVNRINVFGGVWTLITEFVAFYCGGWLAARLCGSPIAGDGRAHGIVTWAFGTIATLVILILAASVVTAPLLHQPLLGGNTVPTVVRGTILAILALLCGLLGGALGGQVGGPRLTEIAE